MEPAEATSFEAPAGTERHVTLRSLADLPSQERVETMKTWFRMGDVPVDFSVADDFGLSGHLGTGRIGDLGVTDMLVDRADGSLRRRSRPGTSRPDLLLVNLTDAGTSAVQQNGRWAALPPGQIVLTSTRYDLEARQKRSSHRYSVMIPYSSLGLPDKVIEPLLAARLHVDDALASTVSGFLLRAARLSVVGDASMAPLQTPLVDMVRGILSAAAGDASRAREPLAQSLFPRIMEYLRARVFDHGLSAARVAHAHGISVRYLYTILAREGVSLGDWIREQRAHRAAELLADPSCTLTIAAIAYQTGYADHAHFARSFRDRHGTTPREWRRQHRIVGAAVSPSWQARDGEGPVTKPTE